MAHHAPLLLTLTEREAGKYVGFTPQALRLWRAQGRGPAYIRHGRNIRYLVADLDVWLGQHRIVPVSMPEAEAAHA